MGAHAAELWLHPGLRRAVVQGDCGLLFRLWRRLSGMNQTQLGELIGMAQPAVSDIERGVRRVASAEVRQRILAGLDVPADLHPDLGPALLTDRPVAALELPSLAPDADLLDRITRTVAGDLRPIRRPWTGSTGSLPNTAAPRTPPARARWST